MFRDYQAKGFLTFPGHELSQDRYFTIERESTIKLNRQIPRSLELL